MADPRFAALSKDAKYRLPDKSFRRKATVDRYGRKVKADEGRKDLERLYRLDKEEKPGRKGKEVKREVVGSDEESSEEAEVEEGAAAKRDPAREGGFSQSEEESEEDDEGSEEEAELAGETAGQEQTEDIPDGEVSRRIAAVNLDWDNLRASDIWAVASSFVPASGRIQRVSVYPSEFGRERLEREELEGPPKEIFATSKDAEDDDDAEEEEEEDPEDESEDDGDEDERIKRDLLKEQADDGSEFNTAALRQYQLERLRYYYAVIECDNKSTAKHLYDSMDGREYLTTANFFDLRFIPDSTSFDSDKPRDECTTLPTGYKPNEFRTEALTHSKVRLTWDDDDTTRKEVQKRAFSRAELDENDLQAYIGSEESDADSTTSRKSAAEDRKARKAAEKRKVMREKLGLGADSAATSTKGSKAEPVGEMTVTFSSGLGKKKSEGKEGVFLNGPQDEESTRIRYIRKEKERKAKRKERAKGRGGEADSDAKEAAPGASNNDAVDDEAEDAGFNDPFFNDPATAAAAEKKARKAERLAKREAKAAKEAEEAGKRKELELLMAGDTAGDAVRHFDMREIEKVEKKKGKKKVVKKGKKGKEEENVEGDVGGETEAFKLDAQDPRFGALFESHEFAIDPSNPRFKGTEGMKGLLEEGRRRKRDRGNEEVDVEDDERMVEKSLKVAKKGKEGGELGGLVARLREGKKDKGKRS
ncbi:pre-rRNA-processing protein esf1 [Recurvomyces mirabilis]|uniref:pre-rRNA-processing protein esf1 n=1 Tax=Recurvomyces mirabilis TaxID=574656 RepID=UPI002DDFC265|nr:pre-rRNA-processing protein esf1 [Recurvomyces mirabilis]